MNFLDILLAIPLGYFIFKGWHRGLIYELTSLVGILVGSWAAVHLSTGVAESLDFKGPGSVLVAFFLIFLAATIAAHFLGKVIERVVKLVKVNFLNKLLGALVGMAKSLIILSVLLNFILIIDFEHVLITPKVQEESILFKPTYNVGNKLTISLKDYIHDLRAERQKQKKA